MNERIQKLIQSIEEVTELFYKQKEQEGYQNLNQIIPLISEVMEYLITRDEGDTISEQNKEIIDCLDQAMHAMEARDTILLADILQYELKEKLEAL